MAGQDCHRGRRPASPAPQVAGGRGLATRSGVIRTLQSLSQEFRGRGIMSVAALVASIAADRLLSISGGWPETAGCIAPGVRCAIAKCRNDPAAECEDFAP